MARTYSRLHQIRRQDPFWLDRRPEAMGLASSPISLKRTDVPEILPGTMAVSHALNVFHHHNPDERVPDGNALRSLRLKGLANFKTSAPGPSSPTDNGLSRRNPAPHPPRGLTPPNPTGKKKPGPHHLACTTQEQAERSIRQMAAISKLLPSPTSRTTHPTTWGSDGSMTPAAAGVLDPKSVTSALTTTPTPSSIQTTSIRAFDEDSRTVVINATACAP
ncbi:hypothetical protein B0H13DRAFT_2658308 [Mycena leptocephala]|nr:hypothetical protein B0H13DRAFT_2658308 [Mycena leptocephala]